MEKEESMMTHSDTEQLCGQRGRSPGMRQFTRTNFEEVVEISFSDIDISRCWQPLKEQELYMFGTLES